jgi:hypothetical protein
MVSLLSGFNLSTSRLLKKLILRAEFSQRGGKLQPIVCSLCGLASRFEQLCVSLFASGRIHPAAAKILGMRMRL